MRIDQSDGADHLDTTDAPGAGRANATGDAHSGQEVQDSDALVESESGRAVLAARAADYRVTVQAVDRVYAIDEGCARVREIEEKTITPVMRRIEAADPYRVLVGLENRLKGRDRIEEKVTHDEQKKGLSAAQVFADMKDAIRYTFQYPQDKYTSGVQADVQRLKNEGAEYSDSRNTWTSEQYKGINSWWRDSESGQLFEVQFHTQASFDAKQATHGAYERLRKLPDDSGEVRELRAFQREVNAKIPIPPGAPDIVII